MVVLFLMGSFIDPVADVGKSGMGNIVEEPCDLFFEGGVFQSKNGKYSQRMVVSGIFFGVRFGIIGDSILMDISESLHGRRVDEFDQNGLIHFDGAIKCLNYFREKKRR